ncbi:MAG: hypothetical protein JXB26_12780 [Candidatus Aminicenantes bacterium]|nr:hypothetical protein [Candidatus Aminicenantes bacterium]
METEKGTAYREPDSSDSFLFDQPAETGMFREENFFAEEEKHQESAAAVFQKLLESYMQDKDHLFREYRFKRKLFRIFVDYVCMNNSIPLKERLEQVEKGIIIRVLNRVNGHQKKAARILGLKYTTLNEKLKKYHIHFQKKPVVF